VSGQGSPAKGGDTENSLTSTTSDFAEQSFFNNLSVVSSKAQSIAAERQHLGPEQMGHNLYVEKIREKLRSTM